MAKKSSLPFVENGYGQVEPNRLTAMVNGEMESQAPALIADGTGRGIPVLENGMFLCLIADTSGAGPMGRVAVLPGVANASAEAYMVFNERKVYDERDSLVDYAMVCGDPAKVREPGFVDGLPFPRLFKITAGDVFTTNTIQAAAGSIVVGNELYIGDDGYLTPAAAPITNTAMKFVVTKVYTMPDGIQTGVKVVAENI